MNQVSVDRPGLPRSAARRRIHVLKLLPGCAGLVAVCLLGGHTFTGSDVFALWNRGSIGESDRIGHNKER